MLKIPQSPETEPIAFRAYVNERHAILNELRILAECKEIMCRHGATADDVFSNSKRVPATRARAQITAFLKDRFAWSYEQLAEFFGHANHATPLQAIRRYQQRLQKGDVP